MNTPVEAALAAAVVLASCSRKFASVLAQGDATGKELPIQGVDSEALESVVRFFYCGECLLSTATVVPIHDVCLKLEVPGLGAGCEAYVQQSLNPATCMTYLGAAVRLLLEPTIKLCLSYATSRFEDVIAAPGFQSLSPEAVRLLLTHMRGGASDISLARALARWAVRKPEHLPDCEAMFQELNITATALLQLLQLPDFVQALQHGPGLGGRLGPAGEAAAAAAALGPLERLLGGAAAGGLLPAADAGALLHFIEGNDRPGSNPRALALLLQQHQQQHQQQPSSSGSGAAPDGNSPLEDGPGQTSPRHPERTDSGSRGGIARLVRAAEALGRAGGSSSRSAGAWADRDDAGQEPWEGAEPRRRALLTAGSATLAEEQPGRAAGRAGGALETGGDGLVAVRLAALEDAGLTLNLLPTGALVASGGPLGKQQLPLQLAPSGSGPNAPLLALLPASVLLDLQDARVAPGREQRALEGLPGEAPGQRPLLPPRTASVTGGGREAAEGDQGSGEGFPDDSPPPPPLPPQQQQLGAAVQQLHGLLPPRFATTGKPTSASAGSLPPPSAAAAAAASLAVPPSAAQRSASLPRASGQLGSQGAPLSAPGGIGGGGGGAAGLPLSLLPASASDRSPTRWTKATSGPASAASLPLGGSGVLLALPTPRSPHLDGASAPGGSSAGGGGGGGPKRRRVSPDEDDPDHVEDGGNARGGRFGRGPGQGSGTPAAGGKAPLMCHVDDCQVDLASLKEYHQRFRICDFHLKAEVVMREGIPQRFCQQCGRFHVLSEFDGAKRSCRARLMRHNARRRKRADAKEASVDYLLDEPRKLSRSTSGHTSSSAPRAAAPQLPLLQPLPPQQPPPPPLAPPNQLFLQPLPDQPSSLYLPLQQMLFPPDAEGQPIVPGSGGGGGSATGLPPPLQPPLAAREAAAATAGGGGSGGGVPSAPLLRLQQQLELQQDLLLRQRGRETQQQPQQRLERAPSQQQVPQQQRPRLAAAAAPGGGELRAGDGVLEALLGLNHAGGGSAPPPASERQAEAAAAAAVLSLRATVRHYGPTTAAAAASAAVANGGGSEAEPGSQREQVPPNQPTHGSVSQAAPPELSQLRTAGVQLAAAAAATVTGKGAKGEGPLGPAATGEASPSRGPEAKPEDAGHRAGAPQPGAMPGQRPAEDAPAPKLAEPSPAAGEAGAPGGASDGAGDGGEAGRAGAAAAPGDGSPGVGGGAQQSRE
ncbi:hypothetical protein GPECTOR_322g32 [Gonium pectorale]|uniref:SBP-type domain-containing protein n=1 Tax=Gonium pectorale TaxID=33097 RepID=A0A150FVP1_GONPE|nr:hypothetical protein GPECTOR_322g32 [Gonium pectorale]|eukprot:KXZ41683.1 hypothetical protein GPECTOR_322g32 [Gonium pectorale]